MTAVVAGGLVILLLLGRTVRWYVRGEQAWLRLVEDEGARPIRRRVPLASAPLSACGVLLWAAIATNSLGSGPLPALLTVGAMVAGLVATLVIWRPPAWSVPPWLRASGRVPYDFEPIRDSGERLALSVAGLVFLVAGASTLILLSYVLIGPLR